MDSSARPPAVTTPRPDLSLLAGRLRDLHRPGDPVVLVNVWDAISARRVQDAGAAALATSSAAVAASLGLPDDNTMAPAVAFDAVRRVAAAADVPVTADLEAGYGLPAAELVQALLAAGAAGCNIEDTDHARPGELVDPGRFASRLRQIRHAAQEAGVDIVLNARIDVHLRRRGADPRAMLDETRERARRYLDAGADCVYPIRLLDTDHLATLAHALDGHVNANLGPGTTVADLAAAGVSRVSIGPAGQHLAMDALSRHAASLLSAA